MALKPPRPPATFDSAQNFAAAVVTQPEAFWNYVGALHQTAGVNFTYSNELQGLADARSLEISNLRAVNETLRQLISAKSEPPPSLSRSVKHPDPEKYSGHKDQLLSFIAQLRIKLLMNEDHFSTPESKVIYAISRLEGAAMSQVLPRIKAGSKVDLDSVEDLIKLLERAFGDPDRKATAQRELRKLKQANRDFHQYLADFQHLAPESEYNEEAQKSFLMDGMCNELKSIMIGFDVPEKLDDCVALLQKLENRRKAVMVTSREPSFTPCIPRVSLPKTSSSAPFSSYTPAPSTIAPSSSVSDSDPMDLSANRKALELVVAERISYIAETQGRLPHNHFGGRKQRSAVQVISYLQEHIYNAWRGNKTLSLVSFDVKGAYNNVAKLPELQRLRERGVPEVLVRWIYDFCTDRKACISANGYTSEVKMLPQSGLPQGSPLAPILFLFFNASLVQQLVRNGGSMAYIDDYTAWVTGASAAENTRMLQEEVLPRLQRWERESGAVFEASKTAFIHFTRNRRGDRDSEIPLLFKG
ncbi:hypothetical protein B0A49_13695 [Cryomyces minteri]|uniref:Reverse transcriptase domain-containing protein n=1 Tax=Cryomyces minteri TaxID=331657 RepID=A0A4V6WKL0_9PEZI|nr:hypothetical protein B0A49_13695 [Cryomyces minteri]